MTKAAPRKSPLRTSENVSTTYELPSMVRTPVSSQNERSAQKPRVSTGTAAANKPRSPTTADQYFGTGERSTTRTARTVTARMISGSSA